MKNSAGCKKLKILTPKTGSVIALNRVRYMVGNERLGKILSVKINDIEPDREILTATITLAVEFGEYEE